MLIKNIDGSITDLQRTGLARENSLDMSFFRDKSRLSDRLKGKSTDEIINEIRSDFDKDRTSFFDRPSTNRTGSRFGPSVDQFFSRVSIAKVL